MSKEIRTIYAPHIRSQTGIIKSWVIMFKNIINSRELVWQLFKRDFLMQYKKSFVGVGWIIISPIVGIISWLIMNQTGILAPGETDIPYPVFLLLSTAIWGLFMGFYGAASGTLGAGSGFITQVNYPHEVLLFKQAFQQLVNFFITFVINLVVLLIFGVVPKPTIILFPLSIIPIFFFAASFGLIISVVSVVASDISSFFGKILTFVFYITPVIFAPEVDNETFQKIIDLNPLTYLIGTARDLIVEGEVQHLDRYLLVSVVSFVLFLISMRLFYISEKKAIERMM
jgi:lipopolysaccharide transport system permease protein